MTPLTANSAEQRTRQRFAKGALLAGLLVAILLLFPEIPRDQEIFIVLPRDESMRVVRVDVSWKQNDEGEPLGGLTLEFPDGAPSVVRHTMSLPNGHYVFMIRTEHQPAPAPHSGEANGAAKSGRHRITKTSEHRVFLEGGVTKLLLKDQDR